VIVVGDTGPLNCLLVINQVDIRPSLFSRVVIPQAVAAELSSARAPDVEQWTTLSCRRKTTTVSALQLIGFPAKIVEMV